MKPSEILRDVIETNPDVKLARTYYDSETGCYCALGLIAKERGYSVEDFSRSMHHVLPEFFYPLTFTLGTGWYANELHEEVEAINDNRDSRTSDRDKLIAIIALLEENGV